MEAACTGYLILPFDTAINIMILFSKKYQIFLQLMILMLFVIQCRQVTHHGCVSWGTSASSKGEAANKCSGRCRWQDCYHGGMFILFYLVDRKM